MISVGYVSLAVGLCYPEPAANDGTEAEPPQGWMARETRCLACSYEWAAVAPVATRWLECPRCKADKGVFTKFIQPDGEDHKIFACLKCSGTLWSAFLWHDGTPSMMCAECGNAVNALDLFP